MNVSLALLAGSAVGLAVACASGSPPQASTPPAQQAPAPAHACTEIGCVDGLMVQLQPNAGWPAGKYEFELSIDGQAATCTGSLPLPSCESGKALSCTGAPVMIGESGCAMPAATHGFSDIMLASAPKHVRVVIRRDGTELISGELRPAYRTSRPNGPDCPPICNSAQESFRVF